MNKLSSPINLIKRAIGIFVKRENFIFLAQVYLPMVFFSILSVTQVYLPDSIRKSNSIWLTIGIWSVQIISLLVTVFVTESGIIAVGKVYKGSKLSTKETFKAAWKDYWIFLLLSTVLALIYFFGFVLLIVPGFLFVVWFAFSRFVTIENNLGIKESLMKSKELVKGNYWKVLGSLVIFWAFTIIIEIILSIIPYGLGSVITALCGGLFMLPLYLLYKEFSA